MPKWQVYGLGILGCLIYAACLFFYWHDWSILRFSQHGESTVNDMLFGYWIFSGINALVCAVGLFGPQKGLLPLAQTFQAFATLVIAVCSQTDITTWLSADAIYYWWDKHPFEFGAILYKIAYGWFGLAALSTIIMIIKRDQRGK
jgi:hypothetical protein